MKFYNEFRVSNETKAAIKNYLKAVFAGIYSDDVVTVEMINENRFNKTRFTVTARLPGVIILDSGLRVREQPVELGLFTVTEVLQLLPDAVVAAEAVVDQRLTTAKQRFLKISGVSTVVNNYLNPWKLRVFNNDRAHSVDLGTDAFTCSDVEFEQKLREKVAIYVFFCE